MPLTKTIQVIFLICFSTKIINVCTFTFAFAFTVTPTNCQRKGVNIGSESNNPHPFNNNRLNTIVLDARRDQKSRLPVGGLSNARRKQLGVEGDEDEYDLDVALDANTDPLITKIIAGSAILAIMILLIVGVVIPSVSDFGEGVCVPIQNGGRC